MRVLVTGGAGYIGSHTVLALIEAGFEPVIIDDFSNSDPAVIDQLEKLSGRDIHCYKADCSDTSAVQAVLQHEPCEAIIHFAGLKAVGESVEQPLRYYEHNVGTVMKLLQAASEADVRRFVFSSTATVYGDPSDKPLPETTALHPQSPYARTKLMIEQILQDVAVADPSWHVTILRYFNPVGAHESGQIGESPLGVPNNLLPFVAQVAGGRRKEVNVWGDDYDTPDGTGIRDYLHVMDLAEGHVKALQGETPGTAIYNLGTGKGTSVLELIAAFEKAAGKPIPRVIKPRRAGDISQFFADPAKASKHLKWTATRSIEDACRDAWRWQSNYPEGYASLAHAAADAPTQISEEV